jgi:hypothetical protein
MQDPQNLMNVSGSYMEGRSAEEAVRRALKQSAVLWNLNLISTVIVVHLHCSLKMDEIQNCMIHC